ncbi:hypothetical protein BKA62DRAFT_707038 [Auriculariales sp. MPI-PUGE-AT-0066]|nr:hypothetical protein BKA62DRAFT_707038 [Auriculariales sp. MPI-PUGE-AT-0066]
MDSPSTVSVASSSASASGNSNMHLRRHLSLGHARPRTHQRSNSQPTIPISVGILSEPDVVGHPDTGFMHRLRRGHRKPRLDASVDDLLPMPTSSRPIYIGPSSSLPPPSLQEIMMGLHLSRTPHLAAPRAPRDPQPPAVTISEEDSPAPAFLFALMRTRAASAPQRPPVISTRRRSYDHYGPTHMQEASTSRTRVPLPPPPAKSSLKRSSVSSDSSSLTPASILTSGSGRGTPSPSLSSRSSHQRQPSKLRFSTLFGRGKHHDTIDVVALDPPLALQPRKSVRFSPAVAGMPQGSGAPLPESVREIAGLGPSPAAPHVASSTDLAVSAPKRNTFARRVSGKAKGAAKEMFAVIADPTAKR